MPRNRNLPAPIPPEAEALEPNKWFPKAFGLWRVQGGALACRALLCGAVAALSLTSTAALALEEPRPCTPSDARVRCIALTRDAVAQLLAAEQRGQWAHIHRRREEP